jgi:hypothetical protein
MHGSGVLESHGGASTDISHHPDVEGLNIHYSDSPKQVNLQQMKLKMNNPSQGQMQTIEHHS